MTAEIAASIATENDKFFKLAIKVIYDAAIHGDRNVELTNIPFETRERLRSLGYKCKEDPHGITWIKW